MAGALAPIRDYGFLPADIRAFIAATDAALPPGAAALGVAEQRALYDRMCALFDAPLPAGMAVADRVIAGVACRVYRPQGVASGSASEAAAPAPVVVYFHGGGFVVGGLESHHAICADLAQAAGLSLVAVDYRLAPEHRHPAAFDDAMAVAGALLSEGPVLLAGDSAGGNLAAAVAAHLPMPMPMLTGQAVVRRVLGQVLIYPGLGGEMTLPSYTRHAQAPMLTRDDVAIYATVRFADGRDGAGDPRAAPLAATDFSGLPPTAIFTAGCDPLASDGVEYAARLAEAGVPVTLTEEPLLVHGYLRARHCAQAARASFARIAAALKDMAEEGMREPTAPEPGPG